MKKKISLVIVVILALAGWFFFRAQNTPVQKIVEIDSDVKPVVKKVVNTEPNTPPSFKFKPNEKKINSRTRVTTDEKFEIFDKLEQVWLSKAQEIIGADKYPIYLDMKNRNDKEKMQAYKEYHDYLRQKYGDKFSYNISDDQSIREKEINQKYLSDLLKLIGPEKFTKYTAAKDQLNEEMRKNNKEAIQIEF